MQRKDTERSTSDSESEISDNGVYSEAHNNVANNEEMQLVIDFDNVEDILDFSVQPLSETANRKKQRPKLRKKMIATEPVKLLELKPKIDNFANDEEKNSEYHEVSHETELKSNRRFQCIYCGSKFI